MNISHFRSLQRGITLSSKYDLKQTIAFRLINVEINLIFSFHPNYCCRRGDKTLIYNHVATNDARLTWGEYLYYGQLSMQKYPLKDCYWMPTITMVREEVVYKICIWLTHLLPALLVDAVRTCRGVRERYLKDFVVSQNSVPKFKSYSLFTSFQDMDVLQEDPQFFRRDPLLCGQGMDLHKRQRSCNVASLK